MRKLKTDTLRIKKENGEYSGINILSYNTSELVDEANETLKNAIEVVDNTKASADSASKSASEASEQAQIAADQAELAKQSVAKGGYLLFDIDENGHLIQYITDNVPTELKFELVEGRLVVHG